MRRDAPFRPPFLVASVLCLASPAALRAQEWETLPQAIINQSIEGWSLECRFGPGDLPEGWVVGYTLDTRGGPGHASAPTPLEPGREITLPKRLTLVFHVKKAASGAGNGSVACVLRPGHGGHENGQLTFHLTFKSGAEPEFMQAFRTLDHHRPERAQILLLAPRSIVIAEQRVDLPGAWEGKEGAPVESKGEAPAKSMAAAGEQLPGLSTRDREAGWHSTSAYYTLNERRTGWDGYRDLNDRDSFFFALHAEGNRMPEEILSDYFYQTIFSYNSKVLVGIEPGFNYPILATLEAQYYDQNIRTWVDRLCHPLGVELMKAPEPRGDFTELLRYHRALVNAMAAWHRNPALAMVGIAYFRQKVVTEKLKQLTEGLAGGKARPGFDPISADPAKAAEAGKLMYAHDRLAADLQTIAFNWMKHGYAAFVARYREADEAGKERAGEFLESYRPAFMDWPKYRKIWEELPKTSQPADRVGDFVLPMNKAGEREYLPAYGPWGHRIGLGRPDVHPVQGRRPGHRSRSCCLLLKTRLDADGPARSELLGRVYWYALS